MAKSIESAGYPLVFKVDKGNIDLDDIANEPDTTAVRVSVRALEGMQKEAIVQYGPTGTVWRMVSDEGPYLNGTDLAPFPLAFYTAGMAFSFMEEVYKQAEQRGVEIESFRLAQDNFYTMEGSALRGDMIGGAKPVDLSVDLETSASPAAVREIVAAAERTSPAQAYNRDVLDNTFSLSLNGQQIPVKRVTASPGTLFDDPADQFDQMRPMADNAYQSDIIIKQKSAETVFDVEGGAGSSLKSEQKRTLHVRGIATRHEDGLKEVVIQLFKPIGSVFRLICDDSDQERAPSSLSYLSAGVGFCFMTQLGRYAHIVKKSLESYEIVQHNVYRRDGDKVRNDPVDTHVYIRFNESADDARQMLHMSEQTCFLHAAMRNAVPSQIAIKTGEAKIALG